LWLAPAVDGALKTAGLMLSAVEVYAVATGPGSFTGARIGLTAVKAWAEVYGKRIAAVSRLEVLARQAGEDAEYVAGFFDGSRGQVFAALYRRIGSELQRVGDEAVLGPAEFVSWVDEQVAALMQPIAATAVQRERESPAADITPLAEAGVPAMELDVDGPRYFWYHHSDGDTLDKLDPAEMARCVAVMAVMAYVVADLPEGLGQTTN